MQQRLLISLCICVGARGCAAVYFYSHSSQRNGKKRSAKLWLFIAHLKPNWSPRDGLGWGRAMHNGISVMTIECLIVARRRQQRLERAPWQNHTSNSDWYMTMNDVCGHRSWTIRISARARVCGMAVTLHNHHQCHRGKSTKGLQNITNAEDIKTRGIIWHEKLCNIEEEMQYSMIDWIRIGRTMLNENYFIQCEQIPFFFLFLRTSSSDGWLADCELSIF